jgi:hypothetical protein
MLLSVLRRCLILPAGAEVRGAMAHGVSQVQSQLQAFLERVRLGRLQSQPVQLPLSQAFLAQGQSGQSQSSKERVSLYPLQVWQALDLSERLLYPLMRMLVLPALLGTGAVGSVTVTGTATTSVTGVQGSGNVGGVSVTGTAVVIPTGVSATGSITPVNVWGLVDDSQTPSWSDVRIVKVLLGRLIRQSNA